MRIKDIKAGMKVELLLYSYDSIKIEASYMSQIHDIKDASTIIVAAPIIEGRIIAIPVEQQLKMIIFEQSGLYYIQTKVDQRGKKGNIHYLKLSILGKLQKIQRREYFRFDWVMPVKLRVIEVNDEQQPLFVNALTRNISGGGIGIAVDKKYLEDTVVEIQLGLDAFETVRAIGQIVRCSLIDAVVNKYELGVLFMEISTKDREAIIKFIFQKQIDLKQKGMV